MNSNNNINSFPIKNGTAFGNPIPVGGVQMQIPLNHNQTSRPHFLTQQSQPQGGVHFPGHFLMSEAQPPVLLQPQSQSQSQSQAQATHISLQHTATRNTAGAFSPSTPGTAAGNAKRTLHKPPSRQSGNSSSGHGQAGTASPLKTMELTPSVRRKKRKLPDRKFPDKLALSFPETSFYSQMLEIESRLDAALVRKKVEIVESIKHPLHVPKMLRIYVFNTHASQLGGFPQNSTSAESPSWSLKITGRILEDGIDPVALGSPHISSSVYPKFSSFFKKITVYLDQNAYPDNHVVLWESSRSPVPRDGFVLKRKGDMEFTAIVRLEMNFVPEKFKLSPALQDILGIEVETRPRIIAALWHYIKTRKLQMPGDVSSFTCDPPLRKVFGEEKLKFAAVIQKITEHLTSLKPIHIEHRIKLSGNSPAGSTYDVLVDVPFGLDEERTRFLASLEKKEEIDAFDGAISAAISRLHEHCHRRDFFLAFSHSPAEFINKLLASQARDLKLVGADTNQNEEKEHRSQFYDQPW